jgi:hypothetical protein
MTNCYASITLALIFIWLSACNSQPPSAKSDPVINPNQKVIRSLTDQVLLALSSHRYARLKTLLPPTQHSLPDAEAAALLLGPNHADIVLEHWNIHQIPVTFDTDSLHATAEVTIRYRRGANRKPITTQTVLRFRRENQTQPWHLHLRRSD